jgi:hypothetical protein
MPTKERRQVIGRARPSPSVMAKPTMRPDSPSTVVRAKDATIKQLKDDLRSVLDLMSEILDEQGLTSSDIEAKALSLRQKWGMT